MIDNIAQVEPLVDMVLGRILIPVFAGDNDWIATSLRDVEQARERDDAVQQGRRRTG